MPITERYKVAAVKNVAPFNVASVPCANVVYPNHANITASILAIKYTKFAFTMRHD